MVSYSGCHLISIAFYQTGFSNVYIKLIEAHVVFLRVRIQINKTRSIRFSGSMRLHNIDFFVSKQYINEMQNFLTLTVTLTFIIITYYIGHNIPCRLFIQTKDIHISIVNGI